MAFKIYIPSRIIPDIINAFKDFDAIAEGDFYFPNPLWECKNTNIRFHGKAELELSLNNNFSAEELNNDKEELISRLRYLKAKFLNILRDDSKKLYIYKIKTIPKAQKIVKNSAEYTAERKGKPIKMSFYDL